MIFDVQGRQLRLIKRSMCPYAHHIRLMIMLAVSLVARSGILAVMKTPSCSRLLLLHKSFRCPHRAVYPHKHSHASVLPDWLLAADFC